MCHLQIPTNRACFKKNSSLHISTKIFPSWLKIPWQIFSFHPLKKFWWLFCHRPQIKVFLQLFKLSTPSPLISSKINPVQNVHFIPQEFWWPLFSHRPQIVLFFYFFGYFPPLIYLLLGNSSLQKQPFITAHFPSSHFVHHCTLKHALPINIWHVIQVGLRASSNFLVYKLQN